MTKVNSERITQFTLLFLGIVFVAFVYGMVEVVQKVNATQIGTSEGIYTSYISTSKEIEKRAYRLTQNCETKLCRVSRLLDSVTDIPYQTEVFQQQTPEKTIANNFGDCDDKSNLLISMLHILGIEAYFVLVPKHIFIIVPLEDSRLSDRKGLWVNGRKYYILETTAKGSRVGFDLAYKLEEIDAIIEPFSNQKMEIESLEYKL